MIVNPFHFQEQGSDDIEILVQLLDKESDGTLLQVAAEFLESGDIDKLKIITAILDTSFPFITGYQSGMPFKILLDQLTLPIHQRNFRGCRVPSYILAFLFRKVIKESTDMNREVSICFNSGADGNFLHPTIKITVDRNVYLVDFLGVNSYGPLVRLDPSYAEKFEVLSPQIEVAIATQDLYYLLCVSEKEEIDELLQEFERYLLELGETFDETMRLLKLSARKAELYKATNREIYFF